MKTRDAGAIDAPADDAVDDATLDDEIEVDLESEDPEETDVGEDDAPGDDGEGGEADGDGEAEVGARQEGQARDVRPPAKRGSARVQAIVARNRVLEQRVATFEQQLQGLINERRQPSPAEQAQAAEAERQHYEMLSPYEQHQFTQNKIAAEVERRTNGIALNLWDQNDRRDYETLVASNPAYRRLDEKVEELRRQAPQVSRRILLATAIGLNTLERGPAARTRAARNSETAAARHATRPSNGRGDVASSRGRAGDSLEERLRNQSI